jgi:hypothetical protein
MAINWYEATLAVGALGTAATGLVDTTKVLFYGGMSYVGFGYIKKLITRTVGNVSGGQAGAGLATDDILGTLLANWINGMETGAQKSIAKSFIKLHFNPSTAAALAQQTNVAPDVLVGVAQKLASVQALTPAESDAFGRFDLALSAMIDRAYERGDQLYRNSCKALAAFIAVGLAFAGNHELIDTPQHLATWQVIIIGLIATPLAPVAKDIANAIQTASDAVKSVKG